MKLGVLFSGGKDSVLAVDYAMKKEEVSCLVTIMSKNDASYMFHTPNIHITKYQSKAMGMPHIVGVTAGTKEEELMDLKNAISEAKSRFGITGIVTGAIESVYQAIRVQKVCHDLDMHCFNPLWQKDQMELLREILDEGYQVIISGVFAYPLEKKWLGRIIDESIIAELEELQKEHQINPSGEGGEIETTVLNGPIFDKGIKVINSETRYQNYSGSYVIKEVDFE